MLTEPHKQIVETGVIWQLIYVAMHYLTSVQEQH